MAKGEILEVKGVDMLPQADTNLLSLLMGGSAEYKDIDKDIEIFYGWIEYVEKVIAVHNVKLPDLKNGKGGRVGKGWLWVIVHEIVSIVDRKSDREGDACLGQALLIGEIFFYWYLRTHLSKVYDTRRPIKGRRVAFRQIQKVRQRMIKMLDLKPNKLDKKMFKGVKTWRTSIIDRA